MCNEKSYLTSEVSRKDPVEEYVISEGAASGTVLALIHRFFQDCNHN